MNISFSKDTVLGLVEIYGKDGAIDEMTSLCRNIIAIGINDLDSETNCDVDCRSTQEKDRDTDQIEDNK